MTHNLYRLMAMEMPGYGCCEAETLFNKSVGNGGGCQVRVGHRACEPQEKARPAASAQGCELDAMRENPVAWREETGIFRSHRLVIFRVDYLP